MSTAFLIWFSPNSCVVMSHLSGCAIFSSVILYDLLSTFTGWSACGWKINSHLITILMSVVCFRFLIGILPIQYPSTLLTKIMKKTWGPMNCVHITLHSAATFKFKREEGRDFISGKTLQGVMSRFVSFFQPFPSKS